MCLFEPVFAPFLALNYQARCQNTGVQMCCSGLSLDVAVVCEIVRATAIRGVRDHGGFTRLHSKSVCCLTRCDGSQMANIIAAHVYRLCTCSKHLHPSTQSLFFRYLLVLLLKQKSQQLNQSSLQCKVRKSLGYWLSLASMDQSMALRRCSRAVSVLMVDNDCMVPRYHPHKFHSHARLDLISRILIQRLQPPSDWCWVCMPCVHLQFLYFTSY